MRDERRKSRETALTPGPSPEYGRGEQSVTSTAKNTEQFSTFPSNFSDGKKFANSSEKAGPAGCGRADLPEIRNAKLYQVAG